MPQLTRRAATSVAAALILAMNIGCSTAPAPTAAPDVRAQEITAGSSIGRQLVASSASIDAAVADLQAGDLAKARFDYGTYDDAWDAIEDGIRDPNPDIYEAIERDMDRVDETLLKVDDPDVAVATDALRTLRQSIDAQAPRLG